MTGLLRLVFGVSLGLTIIAGCGGEGLSATHPPKTPETGNAERFRTIAASLDGRSYYYNPAEAFRSELIFSGLAPKAIIRGNTERKQVALTFDDSPYPKGTPKLLSVLRRLNVKATFFCVGMEVAKYPKVARWIAQDGHEIGNHTFHHVNLPSLTMQETYNEWKAAQDVIRTSLGVTPTLCRPPGGDFDENTVDAAVLNGLTNVFWTVNTGDYRRSNPAEIEKLVFDRLRPGGIILMHDGIESTMKALPRIVERLRTEGYEIVTVGQMIAGRSNPEDISWLTHRALGLPTKKRAF